MRNLEKIVEALEPQVRFNQNVRPDIPKLGESLTEPPEARLIEHPLLTGENLYHSGPNIENWPWPDWDIAESYNIGDRVRASDTEIYESLTEPNTANDPVSSPSDWELLDLFTEYLEEKRKEAIRTLVYDIFNRKKNDRITKEQLDHLAIFNGVAAVSDRVIKRSRFVGFEIRLLQANNLRLVIDSLSTQFTAAQSPLTFYLFHDSQDQAIAEFDISITKPVSREWHNLTKIVRADTGKYPFARENELYYQDLERDLDSGVYYLGYYEDDLSGQAIETRYNFARGPNCGGCSRYNAHAYRKYSQYIQLRAISVTSNALGASPEDLFDVRRVTKNLDTNFGLNLRLSTYCDLSAWLIERPELFADGIKRQLEVDLVKQIVNTISSNYITEQIKESGRIALQGENLGGEGMLSQLEKSKEGLGLELSDIQSSVCLPELPSKGVRYKAVGGSSRARNFY